MELSAGRRPSDNDDYITIEGRRYPKLQSWLEQRGVTTWDGFAGRLHITREVPVPIRGTSSDCLNAAHPYHPWIVGTFERHDIQLERCTACGVMRAWDVSFDILPGISLGMSGARRRHVLLGHFTAPRKAGRTYIGAPPG